MPRQAAWLGLWRAITGKAEPRPWYEKNRERIKLHAETRALVEGLLA